ncbi:MAG: hypothetical protein GF349_01415 [Candidatus Magasanikbacteria bacterium]|nr:hypothetical protein [Candidatus Magasanikbacteria bacterium]
MRMSFSQMKKLKVETASGDVLGNVYDLVVDANTHTVIQYKVKSSVLRTKEYLIHRGQIVRCKEDKIIVEDNVAKEVRSVKEKAKGDPKAEAVAMRKSGE